VIGDCEILVEAAIEPDLPIIDAHHHLWIDPPQGQYAAYPIEQLADERAQSGHAIAATVFVDCHRSYLTTGPEELRPIGETQTIAAEADIADAAGGIMSGIARAIVSHADMTLGAGIERVLDAHIAASPERFRGIRHITPWDPKFTLFGPYFTPKMLCAPEFAAGLAVLARLDLSFDCWLLYPQLGDVAELARKVPEARIVLDHIGAPSSLAGVPAQEADDLWRAKLAEVAACPNVMVKLGGLMMHRHDPAPLGSVEAAEIMRDHVLTAIDLFTPDRCMFESNFPVDAGEISYGNLWNAFKRLAGDFSRTEREAMFSGNAIRTYRMNMASGPG
jgi:L-fuconolactonase